MHSCISYLWFRLVESVLRPKSAFPLQPHVQMFFQIGIVDLLRESSTEQITLFTNLNVKNRVK